tara:strand:- start:4452 stop:4709 length:258 start_codon:yes stop_codon:yes gene_type:complete
MIFNQWPFYNFFPGGAIFSPPKPKLPPPAPPLPTPEQEIGKGAKKNDLERLKNSKRKGRAASILTGSGGDLGGAAQAAATPKTLG